MGAVAEILAAWSRATGARARRWRAMAAVRAMATGVHQDHAADEADVDHRQKRHARGQEPGGQEPGGQPWQQPARTGDLPQATAGDSPIRELAWLLD
jgi:hypothetical protein